MFFRFCGAPPEEKARKDIERRVLGCIDYVWNKDLQNRKTPRVIDDESMRSKLGLPVECHSCPVLLSSTVDWRQCTECEHTVSPAA